ncbi:G protein-regulated inducer of neurite outgrowth 3 [[Leptolyngbya] sp. PCC 7376]|uniref:hypothetical protein n=1 Tax=[Leptolyngbya] sp. PCC 7376 TaxID=111781 RepID=UPI00029F3E93|nr:hypothetical protein [[Leptolyngbya] sp. PCC 7376]AFY38468.1 G protein-regulated inducer of neurite outgrowth 3 [[Leptolyngbya] sp. PCC 7376]
MLKNISLAAIVALGTATVMAPPASANTACSPNDPTCIPQDIPTPPAVLAALGMGVASLRRKKSEENGDVAE